MPATIYNLPPIDVGSSYSFSLILDDADGVPLNLSGYTIACPILLHADDASPILSFSVSTPSGNPGLAILSLSAAQTAALTFDRGFYKVVVTDSNSKVIRYLQGDLTLNS